MPTLITNKRLRVRKDNFVHIKRKLLGSGNLTASLNQEVTPNDILGRSIANAGFSTIELAKLLGVGNGSAVKYLKKPIGQNIYKGELLAYKKGFFGEKVITSPTDGIIDSYDEKNGFLTIKYITKEIPLTAGVYGIIDMVDTVNGEVLIKTSATQIFGVLGVGDEKSGTLRIINGRNDLINTKQITADLINQIIVTGGFIFADALRKAAGAGVGGVISGGINLSDYQAIGGSVVPKTKALEDIGMSIVITEGFGVLPIGEDIFSALAPHEGRFIFIDGKNRRLTLPNPNADSILSLRKVVLPLQRKDINLADPRLIAEEIKIGSTIRITWPPFMGSQGKVIAIDESPTTLESGIQTYLLLVETQKNKIKIAYQNVELI